jgi:hypothetical protein
VEAPQLVHLLHRVEGGDVNADARGVLDVYLGLAWVRVDDAVGCDA